MEGQGGGEVCGVGGEAGWWWWDSGVGGIAGGGMEGGEGVDGVLWLYGTANWRVFSLIKMILSGPLSSRYDISVQFHCYSSSFS